MSPQSTQRELLMAEKIDWWYDAWVGNLFQESPWKDPPLISYAAELYRDRPRRLVESWAPAGLIPIGMLVANDAESVLHALAELKRQGRLEKVLRFFRSDEVSLRRSFSEDLPDLLEVDRYAPILLVRRIYYDQHHHPLLAQELWSPADRELFADRLVLRHPDRFEVATVGIRELPYWSKPDMNEDDFIPWFGRCNCAHREEGP